jgi:hypothetical protein
MTSSVTWVFLNAEPGIRLWSILRRLGLSAIRAYRISGGPKSEVAWNQKPPSDIPDGGFALQRLAEPEVARSLLSLL